MAQINVIKPFIFNDNGEHVHFPVGVVEIRDEWADHWYVKSHSVEVEPEPAKKGKKK